MMRRDGGFTLVELIIVAVLGALVVTATFQVLVTNQRTYTAQGVRIQGTQAVRGALDVLSGELREISPAGGDLVEMEDTAVRIRAMRAVGVTCHDAALGTTNWRVLRIGDWIHAGDSVLVFADNDSGDRDDDAWIATRVSSSDTLATCSGAPAQRLGFPSSIPFSNDSVSSGAQVRVFTHMEYGLMEYDGRHYLGRRSSAGDWTPVVGPLSDRGVEFAYLDSDGLPTLNDGDVRQIRVTVRTDPQVVGSTGSPVADSVTVRIYTRN